MMAQAEIAAGLRLACRTGLIATGLLAAACGGGGGGGGGGGIGDGGNGGNGGEDPPCIETHDQGCLDSAAYAAAAQTLAAEHAAHSGYSNQWGLATVNADQAYAHQELATGTAPGAGVTVGLFDSEIYTDHPAFAGKTVSQRRLWEDADYPTSIPFSHGTAVASVIAGIRPAGDIGAQGVAWGADLRMFSIPTGGGGGGGNYSPISVLRLALTDNYHSGLISMALSEGVDILNVSLGVAGIIENYTEKELRDNYQKTLTALAQAGADRKTIVVISAGNAHGRTCTAGDDNCPGGTIDATSPELWPGLSARIRELRGHVVSVVAVGEDGSIAGYSNRCGISSNWCLAAPGTDVPVAFASSDGRRGWTKSSGTSYAAPMVSGGLAIMQQLFRSQLSPEELVVRLYQTADKSGRYADFTAYGQGLMDLGAATAPVGQLAVLSGNRIGGRGVSLRDTAWNTGSAFGDGVRRGFGGREIAGFDRLGAPFWFRLGSLVRPASHASISARIHNLVTADAPSRAFLPAPVVAGHAVELAQGQLQLQRWGGRFPSASGHLALAGPATALTWKGNAMGVSAFTTEGTPNVGRRAGAAFFWKPDNILFGLRAGVLSERDEVLGGTSGGAFGGFSANTVFAGAAVEFEAASWHLGGSFELGLTDARSGSGLVAGVSQLATSTMTLRAERHLQHGRVLRFSLSQPLRVERGQAGFSLPVGRQPDGTVLREHWTGSLAPSGRQLDASAALHLPLGPDAALHLGAVWSQHPGHDARADAELAVMAGYRHTF